VKLGSISVKLGVPPGGSVGITPSPRPGAQILPNRPGKIPLSAYQDPYTPPHMPIADPGVALPPQECPGCQAFPQPAPQAPLDRSFSGLWREIERGVKRAKKAVAKGFKALWEIVKPAVREAWRDLQRYARHAIDVLAASRGVPLSVLRRVLKRYGVDADQLTDEELCQLRMLAWAEAHPGQEIPPDLCEDLPVDEGGDLIVRPAPSYLVLGALALGAWWMFGRGKR